MAFSDKQSEHLLVVDDDPRIRQMLIRYFEGEGYQVTAVGDGAAMRAAVERQAFTAIFLDLVLPGGEDGLSLLRDIRTRSDVPVLMLTGRDDVLDKVVGLEVGADDYIAKPFHLREVLARLRTILRRRQPMVNGVKNASEDETLLRFDGWTPRYRSPQAPCAVGRRNSAYDRRIRHAFSFRAPCRTRAVTREVDGPDP
jgi:two-component system phosphate regulon response regulator OmpR